MNILQKCPICTCSDPRPYQFGGLTYRRCTGCAVIFLAEEQTPEELAQQYTQAYFEEDYKKGAGESYFLDRERAVVGCASRVNTIASYVSLSGARVLDVGCAAGYFLEALKRYEPTVRVEGVEVSEDAARAATTEYNIPIVGKDLREVAGESQYDVITLFQTLEHLHNPSMYMKECYRLLRPGGYLFVEVPNMHTVDRIFDRTILERIFSVPYHVYIFNPVALKIVLRNAGFPNVQVRAYLSASVGAFLRRIYKRIRRNEGLGKGNQTQVSIGSPRPVYTLLRNFLARVAPGSNMIAVARKEECTSDK